MRSNSGVTTALDGGVYTPSPSGTRALLLRCGPLQGMSRTATQWLCLPLSRNASYLLAYRLRAVRKGTCCARGDASGHRWRDMVVEPPMPQSPMCDACMPRTMALRSSGPLRGRKLPCNSTTCPQHLFHGSTTALTTQRSEMPQSSTKEERASGTYVWNRPHVCWGSKQHVHQPA